MRLARILVAGVSAASIAASCSARGYPFWRVTETADADAGVREVKVEPASDPSLYARQLGCAWIVVEVVRSGKQGMGVIAVDQSPKDCSVHVVTARFRVGSELVPPLRVDPWDAQHSTYLGFAFDNQKLWNAGIRSGELELVLEGAAQGAITFHMYHSYRGPHDNTSMGSWPLQANQGNEEHYAFPTFVEPDAGEVDGGVAP